ncbi:DUF4283 domain protein [Cucumis melo var. makuwa]|uniref:DUF4283 domain protein n=1 Tax=Cucumis melo var. makuwa TaxID=1194695 RepID=A0A5D3CPI5_CUCMM|nr:DUF4283 domain protein [Cucumis melo var. makuwa]
MKLIPSYGDWLSFRGIPIHVWTYDTFVKIRNVCGGFTAKETIEMTDLLEAKIKVHYNYSGFIPAFIRINDQKGKFFTVQTYSPISGKWLMERGVKIHGSFKRQAAIQFDEFNSKCE